MTGAAGVALVAVGLAYGAAAESAADAVSQQYSAETESNGKRDVTLQWVGYGVGAAAIVTGAVLYIHGMPSDNAPVKTAGLGLRGGASIRSQRRRVPPARELLMRTRPASSSA